MSPHTIDAMPPGGPSCTLEDIHIPHDTVMLVEPDRGLAKILADTLTTKGYVVHKSGSATEALDIYRDCGARIIICSDLVGKQACLGLVAKVKEECKTCMTIVLVESGDTDFGYRCLGAGASDFLLRPVSQSALDIVLSRAQTRIQLRRNVARYAESLESLHLSQLMYQQLVEVVPCYISLHSKDFRLVGFNKRFADDFGDYIGEHCYKVYKHRQSRCPNCPVAKTFEDGQSHTTEEVVTSKNGEQIYILTYTAPIRDVDGQIVQVMEMSTNITQIRKLQSHLANLGLLIGSISHGVKGLLTALDGGVYRLESALEKGDMDKGRDAGGVIKHVVDRIRHLVLDLLYYAKERELHFERVNVMEFATDVAKVAKAKAESRGVGFATDFQPAVGDFEIDPSVVHSALINFLDNAVDACVGKERPEDEEPLVRLAVERVNGSIRFTVEDNGEGMDQDTLERIFTLFFSSKGSAGTGLGLYISNQVVEQHGGSITVESEPGKGSRFIVTLPIKHQEGK